MSLHLNNEHSIFDGHFPGKAVVPGVTMIQLIIDSMSSVFHRKYRLKSLKFAKFSNLLQPSKDEVNVTISFLMSTTELQIKNAALTQGDLRIFSMKGNLHDIS